MKKHVAWIVFLLIKTTIFSTSALAQNDKPNVLFISIDDMNDWTTLFNKDNPINTPNLVKLAGRGAFFSKTYSSSPACNPSRVSVMTGTRPHKTGVYGNHSDWRATLPNAETIQQYFMKFGYYVGGAGKIFHHQKDWAFHDDASFHEFLLMKINEPYPPSKLNGLEDYGSRNTDWGVWPEDIKQTVDYKTVEYATDFLQREHIRPFFLNVGIYKPHSPFFAPEEFFKRYPVKDLEMPNIKNDDWDDLPLGAKSLMQNTRWFWKGMLKAMEKDPDSYSEFIQAYQACATFADEMLGNVIESLDKSPYRDNTIIVLWSDHGFHLGEKEHIEKFGLWEKTTHVPYIIVAPDQVSPGTVINKPVDLTTIYPTLAELCGLPLPKVDSKSAMALLKNKEADFPPAFMTYRKGNHAIRNTRWRYIQYADGTEELYDHNNDPNEWNNLAEEEKYQEVIEQMKKHLPKENAASVANLEE